MTSKTIGACFAFTCFTAAIFVGWSVGNPATTVIIRAMIVMALAWWAGQGIAAIGQSVVDDNVRIYKEQHPIPASPGANTENSVPQEATPVILETPDNELTPNTEV